MTTINLDILNELADLCRYIEQAEASDPVVVAAQEAGRITHRDIEVIIVFRDGEVHADAAPKGKLKPLLDVFASAHTGGEGPIYVHLGQGTDVGA